LPWHGLHMGLYAFPSLNRWQFPLCRPVTCLDWLLFSPNGSLAPFGLSVSKENLCIWYNIKNSKNWRLHFSSNTPS
jgi:hypothetical protein